MEINKEQYLKDLKERGENSPNHKYSWQVLASEMTQKFGIQMYFIFYKYPENKIRDAYEKCKKEGAYRMDYLIENIKGM